MTTTKGTKSGLSFNVSNRHAGLRLLAIGALYTALALGFVASVEQTSRRPNLPSAELTRAAAPLGSPGGTTVAQR